MTRAIEGRHTLHRRRPDREWGAALVLGTAHGAQHFLSSLLPPLIPLLTIGLGYPLWQLGLLVTLLVVGGSIWGANPARDTLVSDISPDEWEGRTFGYLWTFTQVLSAISPVVIGYVADVSSIQRSFAYLAVATLVASAAAALLLSPRVYVSADPASAASD